MKSALDIAQYFVNRNQGHLDLTNLKIQKLVYYAQGFHLALYGKPLFGEPIEAWDLGPVVRDLYNRLKVFEYDVVSLEEPSQLSHWHQETVAFLDRILELFANHSASSLVSMTHKESPWLEWYEQGKNSIIPQESIRKHFSDRLEEVGTEWVFGDLEETLNPLENSSNNIFSYSPKLVEFSDHIAEEIEAAKDTVNDNKWLPKLVENMATYRD